MWYTAPNAANKAIMNKHFYRNVIEEPKSTPIEKQSNERQTKESLDDDPPPEPTNPNKKSQAFAGLESSLGDACKPPAREIH
jgi:hypothetical protein